MLYVSFTCLPSRIDNIQIVLDSIKNQTMRPDFVIINYPKKCLRLNVPYDIKKLKSYIADSGLNIILNEQKTMVQSPKYFLF